MAVSVRQSLHLAPGIRLAVSANNQATSCTLPTSGLVYRLRLNTSLNQRKRAQAEELRQKRSLQQQTSLANNQDLAQVSLALDAQGKLTISNLDGTALNAVEHSKLLLNFNAEIHTWLEEQIEQINGNLELLTNLHQDTLNPDISLPAYYQEPFTQLQPDKPQLPPLPPEPQQPAPLTVSWRDKLVPGRHKKLLATWQEQHQAWQTQQHNWQQQVQALEAEQAAPLAAYQQELATWRQRKEVHDAQQRQLAAEFNAQLHKNPAVMLEVLNAELEALDWARATQLNLELNASGSSLHLEVDLPDIASLPTQAAKLGARELHLVITDYTPAQIQRNYLRHLHSLFLRLISVSFYCLPTVQKLTLNGYQQLKPHKHACLLAAQVTRQEFAQVNFHNLRGVDPAIALEQFSIRANIDAQGRLLTLEPLN